MSRGTGTPSFWPWVACSAISSAPMAVPTTMAMKAHQKVSPKLTTTPPSTTLKILVFAPSQSVNWCQTLPCRSLSGMMSMWCSSMSRSADVPSSM
jgi:hypothetical protein